MPDESYAFVDRKCPRCNGDGTLKLALPVTLCPLCRGTGIVGSYEPVPDMPQLNSTLFCTCPVHDSCFEKFRDVKAVNNHQ